MRNDAEFMPIISNASICWVVRIVPSSEAMLEPTFPESIKHMMEDENSKSMISTSGSSGWALSKVFSLRSSLQASLHTTATPLKEAL